MTKSHRKSGYTLSKGLKEFGKLARTVGRGSGKTTVKAGRYVRRKLK